MADEQPPEESLAEGAPPKADPESAAAALTGNREPAAGPTAPAPAAAALDETELREVAPDKGAASLDLDFILDIPLNITVEVGRTKLLIQELLQLGQGSVIELDKLMGEPFEVLVNEKLVARGEIVVVNDRFGVRLTDIISPTERVRSLA